MVLRKNSVSLLYQERKSWLLLMVRALSSLLLKTLRQENDRVKANLDNLAKFSQKLSLNEKMDLQFHGTVLIQHV